MTAKEYLSSIKKLEGLIKDKSKKRYKQVQILNHFTK